MEFITTTLKNACKIRLISGSLTSFTGTEIHIGIGEAKTLPRRKMITLMRKVVMLAKQNRQKAIEVDFKDVRRVAEKKITDFDLASLMASAFEMANYEPTTYKTKPKEGFASVETVAMLNVGALVIKGIKRGHYIARAVNACRELCNTPGGDMTPEHLANAAIAAAAGTKAKVKVLG